MREPEEWVVRVMSQWTQEQVDAAADVLRRRLMTGFQCKWDDLPEGKKRRWRQHAMAALYAAGPRKGA